MAIRIGGAASALAFAEAGARRALATQPTVAVEGAVNMVRATPDTRRPGWEHARAPRVSVGDPGDGRQEPGPPEVLGGGVYIGAGGEVVIGVQDDLHFWSLDDWRTWSRLGVDDRIESINLENYAEGPRREEEPERPSVDPAVSDRRSPETSADPRLPEGLEERRLLSRPHERDGPWHRGRDPTLDLAGSGHDVGDRLGAWLDVPAPGPAKHPHWVEPPAEGRESATHLDVER